MTEYLFLGGQYHGTEREVPDDAPVVKGFVASTTPSPNGLIVTRELGAHLDVVASGLTVQSWVRRVMTATDPATGETFRTAIYVHESVTDPQQMGALLANHLMVTFARNGSRDTFGGMATDA